MVINKHGNPLYDSLVDQAGSQVVLPVPEGPPSGLRYSSAPAKEVPELFLAVCFVTPFACLKSYWSR